MPFQNPMSSTSTALSITPSAGKPSGPPSDRITETNSTAAQSVGVPNCTKARSCGMSRLEKKKKRTAQRKETTAPYLRAIIGKENAPANSPAASGQSAVPTWLVDQPSPSGAGADANRGNSSAPPATRKPKPKWAAHSEAKEPLGSSGGGSAAPGSKAAGSRVMMVGGGPVKTSGAEWGEKSAVVELRGGGGRRGRRGLLGATLVKQGHAQHFGPRPVPRRSCRRRGAVGLGVSGGVGGRRRH
eukprot:scaffold2829_cov119-Isochrysis_galbana.AAC.4